jgi:UDP-N-acetyl-D-glucosamine dehydrogenase
MKICVIGLGKIGLPLAVHFAKKGNKVIGADINPLTVSLVNFGIEPFPEEENLQEYLSEVILSGMLRATENVDWALSESDVVIVVVPLFTDKKASPKFDALDNVTKKIAENLKPGMLISYETTLPVGTTRTRFLPVLEKTSGLNAGGDFHLVFSPERVLTGRVFEDLRKYPKIVGGVTQACTKRGSQFYSQVLDFDERPDLSRPNGVWSMDSSESSEFVKLAETTYRDVNIGLANQFSVFAGKCGLNIFEIIESANSQPYSHIHSPGISVGGHCIPIYPQFYLWNDPDATVVQAAREMNSKMPLLAIQKLERVMGSLSEKTIAVLGLTYRAGVKEIAFSGSLVLRDELVNRGAKVVAIDPLYSNSEIEALGFKPLENAEEVDSIIIHTSHSEFLKFNYEGFTNLQYIFDGRNMIKGQAPLKGVQILTL